MAAERRRRPGQRRAAVNNVLLGTYTITETVAPLGYVIDADPTRVVTVTPGNLTQVIGVQGFDHTGVTDESDFHNSVIQVSVGSIAWEKRATAATGAAGRGDVLRSAPIRPTGSAF